MRRQTTSGMTDLWRAAIYGESADWMHMYPFPPRGVAGSVCISFGLIYASVASTLLLADIDFPLYLELLTFAPSVVFVALGILLFVISQLKGSEEGEPADD
jgi:hypothetical protein